jgi:hypothetical protein
MQLQLGSLGPACSGPSRSSSRSSLEASHRKRALSTPTAVRPTWRTCCQRHPSACYPTYLPLGAGRPAPARQLSHSVLSVVCCSRRPYFFLIANPSTFGPPRRFQAAVALINKIDVGKFPAVLTRLFKKLHAKV